MSQPSLNHLRKCDKICVVHAGTVVEEGSHKDLMAVPGGRYKALVNAAEGSINGTGSEDLSS